jgi:hypothetical protein
MLAYLDTLIGFAVVMLGASLIITVLTQMASALMSHRGANLKWGLEVLFKNIPNCPLLNDAERAEKVARDVLTHPLISDSIFSMKLPLPIPKAIVDRFQLATAIHPNELVAILKDLSTKPAYQAIAGLPAEIDALIAAQAPAARGAAAGAPAPPAQPVENAVNAVRRHAGELDAWFHATMDRVSSRFTTYIRLWTVAFASALALVTGLNTVALLNELYTNGDFRQQVAGSATAMTDLANRVVPGGSNDAATKMYTDLLTKALATAQVTVAQPPAGIGSQSAAGDWIKAHVDAAQQPAVQSAFDTAFLNQRTQDAAAVRTILTKASFDITQFSWKHDQPLGPQIPGVLVTAALLSLGAPFWFNMLKQLTNLRPLLANKQDAPAK